MEEESPREPIKYAQDQIQHLKDAMCGAIMGIQNSSTSGPDGISYRLIKVVTDTLLGKELIYAVAVHLLEANI